MSDHPSFDLDTLALEFVAFSGIGRGQKVLDAACGMGAATQAAARAVGPAGKVIGADISPEMLAVAARRVKSAGPTLVEFREMSAQSLDLVDLAFDAVICHLGLMNFARPDQALKEMLRVAKRGGVVSCLVPGAEDKMLFTSLFIDAVNRHVPELCVGGPSLHAFGAPGALERAFTSAGLEQTGSLRKDGIFSFASEEDCWLAMTEGAGRTGAALRTLSPAMQATVKRNVLRAVVRLQRGGRLEVPYEFVMAKGVKSNEWGRS